jgi:ribosomal 50S subunit-associated protein YjgA (DUF615 family)
MAGDPEAVTAALDELVRADGAHFELLHVHTDVVRLRLVIDDDACAECVVARPILEAIALKHIRTALPDVAAIEIDDPRESA